MNEYKQLSSLNNAKFLSLRIINQLYNGLHTTQSIRNTSCVLHGMQFITLNICTSINKQLFNRKCVDKQ